MEVVNFDIFNVNISYVIGYGLLTANKSIAMYLPVQIQKETKDNQNNAIHLSL